MKTTINTCQHGISSATKTIWNILSINIGWLACIWAAARGYHWLGLIIVPILFVIHITWIEKHKTRAVLIVALMSMIIGFAADTLLIVMGAVEPNRWIMPPPLTTLWDVMIWANFSLALNVSLRFLQNKPLAAALLGAAFAPGTYYAGDRLGALVFSEPVLGGLVCVGAVWFFVMPGLSLMARYFYLTKGSLPIHLEEPAGSD